ncbi:hypothetical protein B0H15DRAFT_846483 [Mycena belliarum]|uniref:Uncharacterized protein n=1 Tax=Mycena belliarum TaxID=1033014 RepID=A0AAD6U5V2_9AGAR|nr:hypothetical protein B0H15DRAFT_846483 [Mycena belliae]
MARTPIPARRPTSTKAAHVRPPTASRVNRSTRLPPIRPAPIRARDDIYFSDDENDEYDGREHDRDVSPSPVRRRPSYSWEDETTLVSALLYDGSPDPADPDAKLTAMADSLQVPFMRAGTALLEDMAHTLQPAVQRVTAVHRTLSRRVDPAFATGLLAFDDACKGFEALVIDEHQALQHAFTATETRIKELFAQLEEAYRHRDRLWTDLDAVIATTVDPALAALAEVPATTERTIDALEKHAKTLATKNDDGADKIRGMLAKFV